MKRKRHQRIGYLEEGNRIGQKDIINAEKFPTKRHMD
jgi:hypothetical protein